jgi:hypothetical protein
MGLLPLPRGLRVVFTITAVENRLANGGVAELLTGPDATILPEALEDYRLIGARKHVAMLRQAMKTWNSPERLDEAGARDFGEWDRKYFTLDISEPLDPPIMKFLRSSPDGCLTSTTKK